MIYLRDSKLKTNYKLILREPSRRRILEDNISADEQDISNDEDGEEGEHGEDEIEEMAQPNAGHEGYSTPNVKREIDFNAASQAKDTQSEHEKNEDE